MKSTTLVRAAARTVVVGATAAALTLGGANLASADDSGSATLKSNDGATSASSARKAITSIGVTSPVIRSKGGARVYIALGGTVPAGTNKIVAKVRNGNRQLALVTLSASGRGSFQYYRGYGRGARAIGPLYFYNGTRFLGQQSTNRIFYARSAVKGKVRITSRGSAKRVKATAKVYSFAKGKYVSAKRVKFQVRVGGKWKTKKNIKLNKAGRGNYSFRANSTRKYRIKVPATAKVAGGKTSGIRI